MKILESYPRFLALTAASIVLFSFLACFAAFQAYPHHSTDTFPTLLSYFLAGPFLGWGQYFQDDAVVQNLWTLVPFTLLTLGLLVRGYAHHKRRLARLILIALFWISAGWFYGFAKWL